MAVHCAGCDKDNKCQMCMGTGKAYFSSKTVVLIVQNATLDEIANAETRTCPACGGCGTRLNADEKE